MARVREQSLLCAHLRYQAGEPWHAGRRTVAVQAGTAKLYIKNCDIEYEAAGIAP